MGLTDFFIDYVPMYNKFRAVSSILVIAEFTIPLLAIFALKEILSKPDTLKLKENRGGVIATSGTDCRCCVDFSCCSGRFLLQLYYGTRDELL